ncbi:MAG: hypothetical protein Q3971_03985 [Moraxella sp.]|nr:hypothetical protein [Moraxella sp.]
MKLKALLLSVLLVSGFAHAKYLCSYETYISQNNTVNSEGKSLARGNTKASAAAIIQQDRADFYQDWRDSADENDDADCYFNKKTNRMKIPAMLNRGSISASTIRQIVQGNVWISVDVYSTHIDVSTSQ